MKVLKSIKWSSGVFFLSLVSQSVTLAGAGGSGGGAVVYCEADSSNRFPKSGVYAYDYVISGIDFQGWMESEKTESEALVAFAEKISMGYPLVFWNRKKLIDVAKNFDREARPIPQGMALGELDLPDPRRLPTNCKKDSLRQVIYLTQGKYFIDQELFNELKSTDPSQSLVIKKHELLRVNFDWGADRVADWTVALNSASSALGVAASLLERGLISPEDGEVNLEVRRRFPTQTYNGDQIEDFLNFMNGIFDSEEKKIKDFVTLIGVLRLKDRCELLKKKDPGGVKALLLHLDTLINFLTGVVDEFEPVDDGRRRLESIIQKPIGQVGYDVGSYSIRRLKLSVYEDTLGNRKWGCWGGLWR